jgi:hypothetical protein
MAHLVQAERHGEAQDPFAYSVRYRDPVTQRNTEPSQLPVKAVFMVAKHGIRGAREKAEAMREGLDTTPVE